MFLIPTNSIEFIKLIGLNQICPYLAARKQAPSTPKDSWLT